MLDSEPWLNPFVDGDAVSDTDDSITTGNTIYTEASLVLLLWVDACADLHHDLERNGSVADTRRRVDVRELA